MLQTIIFPFLILLLLVGPYFSFAQESKTPSKIEEAGPPAYPVVLGDQILFKIQGEVEGYKGFNPEERARSISVRIKTLAEDFSISVDSLVLDDVQKPMTMIVSEGKPLLTILDSDAAAAGSSREELAAHYKEKIRQAIVKYREDRSRESIIYGTVL